MNSLRVTVSGAAGRIAYALLPIICSGHTFGHEIKISLKLLDIDPCIEKLHGILMELEDSTFPLRKLRYFYNAYIPLLIFVVVVESVSVYTDAH